MSSEGISSSCTRILCESSKPSKDIVYSMLFLLKVIMVPTNHPSQFPLASAVSAFTLLLRSEPLLVKKMDFKYNYKRLKKIPILLVESRSKNLMTCFFFVFLFFFLFLYKKNSLERRNEVELFEHFDGLLMVCLVLYCWQFRLALEAHIPSGRDVCLYSIVKSGTRPWGLYQLSALDFTIVLNYTVCTFSCFSPLVFPESGEPGKL